MKFSNPDQVIKHVDGDYDPPTDGIPDNHCYPMWYNGHGIDTVSYTHLNTAHIGRQSAKMTLWPAKMSYSPPMIFDPHSIRMRYSGYWTDGRM